MLFLVLATAADRLANFRQAVNQDASQLRRRVNFGASRALATVGRQAQEAGRGRGRGRGRGQGCGRGNQPAVPLPQPGPVQHHQPAVQLPQPDQVQHHDQLIIPVPQPGQVQDHQPIPAPQLGHVDEPKHRDQLNINISLPFAGRKKTALIKVICLKLGAKTNHAATKDMNQLRAQGYGMYTIYIYLK